MLKYVGEKSKKEFANDLKTIYQAPSEDAALERLERVTEYAQNMLDDMGHFENMLLRNTVMGLFVNLSRCIEDNYSQKQCSLKIQTDRKLRKMIQKRKSGIGIREEQNMTN